MPAKMHTSVWKTLSMNDDRAAAVTAPGTPRYARASWAGLIGAFLWLAAETVPADTLPALVREPAPGILLVADHSLIDPNFSRTVVLLTYHGLAGSIGLIINRSSNVSVVATLPDLQGLEDPDARLHFGGPLELRSVRLLVGSSADVEGAERLVEDVYFVNSTIILRTLLADLPAGKRPAINYYAGYAGWSSGQLASEIARGDWHLIKADHARIFEHDQNSLWEDLMESLEGTWVLMENAVLADNSNVKTVTNRALVDGRFSVRAYNCGPRAHC